MTDKEIICTFMEPRDKYRVGGICPRSMLDWWQSDCQSLTDNFPVKLTLDHLREVEARLTNEQWLAYMGNLWGAPLDVLEVLEISHVKNMLHASAEQKIKALASVIGG